MMQPASRRISTDFNRKKKGILPYPNARGRGQPLFLFHRGDVLIQGPVVLLVLDGIGDGARNAFDAPFVSGMPHFNRLRRRYAATQLTAGGEPVGLPPGQFGNSEVGHMTLGAGRMVQQELTRIDAEIASGRFRGNIVIGELLSGLKASGKRLHLVGLLSSGGVHSHQSHLVALARWAQAEAVPTTIHAILDGRDTAQKSARGFLAQLGADLGPCPLVRVGSLCGRYFAMDRDRRWERVRLAWQMLVGGLAEFNAADSLAGIEAAYARGETDEFVKPTTLADFRPISDGDGIVFFNFRADRARQLSHALADPGFDGFPRAKIPDARLVTLTRYDPELDPFVRVAFAPQRPAMVLGEVVADLGWKQLRIAETEKYAHVTYFFNGGREEPFEGEERRLIPSPKVATYDLMPEMSCFEVTRQLVESIRRGPYRLIVCNLANGDMVGHTGELSAAVMACTVVDDAIRQTAEAVLERAGALFVTADHGNAECMRDEAGNPHTAHTFNSVPAVLVARGLDQRQLRAGGSLRDVAPTLLEFMAVDAPKEMQGRSLLRI